MLERDSIISQSGFEVLGRCGNLRFKTDRDDDKGLDIIVNGLPMVGGGAFGPRNQSICGLSVTNHPAGSSTLAQTLRATLGGLVVLGSDYVALTVAHVLVEDAVAGAYPHECTEDDTGSESSGQEHEHDCVRVRDHCFLDDETSRCLDIWSDERGNPAVSHTFDWALLKVYPGYPFTRYGNSTVVNGETLRVERVARCDPENEQVLILRQESKPMRAFCSGTPSIISCGQFMGLAFTIKAINGEERFQPGVSGSWVINRSTGDLYGIVVAGFEGDDEAYMIRASEIFADIARICGVEPKFPRGTLDEEVILLTRRRSNGSTDLVEKARQVSKRSTDAWPITPRRVTETPENEVGKAVLVKTNSDSLVPEFEGNLRRIEVLSFAGKYISKTALFCESLDHSGISSTLASELGFVGVVKHGRQEIEMRIRDPNSPESITHVFCVEENARHDLTFAYLPPEYLSQNRRGMYSVISERNKGMVTQSTPFTRDSMSGDVEEKSKFPAAYKKGKERLYRCCDCHAIQPWSMYRCDRILSDGRPCGHPRSENHCDNQY